MTEPAGAPASLPERSDSIGSWWPPLATFFTVLGSLFFGLTSLADSSYAPALLSGAPVVAIALLSTCAAFVSAFVIAPWKRIHVSFGSQQGPVSSQPKRTAVKINDVMATQIRTFFSAGQYYAILRRARWFSRYLWIENCIEQRIEVGDIVRQSAIRVGDRGAEAAALIDDIGWSQVIQKNFSEAERALKEGVKAAKDAKEPFWEAKGYRHLAGLNIELGHYADAYVELDRAWATASQIVVNERDEMRASIEYGRALCALRERDYDRCAEFLEKAEEIGHPKFVTRGYFLRGMVFLRTGAINDADGEFQRGIVAAANSGNRLEEIRNRQGLIELHVTRGDVQRAHEEQLELERIETETPAPYEHSDPTLTRRPPE